MCCWRSQAAAATGLSLFCCLPRAPSSCPGKGDAVLCLASWTQSSPDPRTEA